MAEASRSGSEVLGGKVSLQRGGRGRSTRGGTAWDINQFFSSVGSLRFMRAILFDVHGGPEVLREGEVGMPILGEGEVLVRVKACALNQLDIWARKGVPSVRIPLPHT